MRTETYQVVTDRIVKMLEQGVRPWAQSWNAYAGGGRPLRSCGTPYRGANVVNLWAAGMVRGFSSPYWITFKKAKEMNASVRKGAKAEYAFYASTFTQRDEKTGEDRTVPFLKSYSVFNAEEVEDLAPYFYRPAEITALDPSARIDTADAFILNTGAHLVHGGGRAYYRPSTDTVHLPEFGAFLNAPAYYGTAFHELAHWSGAEKRLARTFGKYGDPAYAFEELVAELTAAFVSADLTIATEPREDHASYLAGWLKVMKEDNRAIFRAASHAERAAEFLRASKAESLAEAA